MRSGSSRWSQTTSACGESLAKRPFCLASPRARAPARSLPVCPTAAPSLATCHLGLTCFRPSLLPFFPPSFRPSFLSSFLPFFLPSFLPSFPACFLSAISSRFSKRSMPFSAGAPTSGLVLPLPTRSWDHLGSTRTRFTLGQRASMGPSRLTPRASWLTQWYPQHER